MPIVLAAVIVLVLVTFFAAPALAERLRGGQVAQPVVVAVTDTGAGQIKLDKHITFDSQINGAIKFDLSSSKLADKWRVTSLQCDDVTVVATDAQGIVASAKAGPAGDPASCVYSMKVPSGESLSVYAVLGSGKSVGITGLHKLADGSYAKVATTSDLKTENFLKLDSFKGGLQTIKLASGGTETLPLYLKLDT